MSISVVQVGFGSVGRRRAEMLEADARVRLVGIVDVDADARAKAAARYGSDRVTADYTATLAKTSPDAVVVSTPNQTHCEVALHALEVRAHVLCEKPLSIRMSDARAMEQAARSSGRILKLGANHHFFPAVVEARRLMKTGTLGGFLSAEVAVGHGRLATLPGWLRDPTMSGGGTLIDNGSHAVLLACKLCEASGSTATRAGCELQMKNGVDVLAKGFVEDAQGRRIDIRSTWIGSEGYEFHVVIRGEEGVLTIPDPGTLMRDDRALPVHEGFSWALDTADFVRAIVDGDSPEVGVGDAMRCMSVIMALYESAARGEHVVIP